MARVHFSNEKGDGQVREVVVRGGDDRARRDGMGFVEDAGNTGIADDHRRSQPADGADEAIAGVALDDHDRFAVTQQFLDDTVSDGAESADDGVAAIGDAPYFESATETGAEQIIRENGC